MKEFSGSLGERLSGHKWTWLAVLLLAGSLIAPSGSFAAHPLVTDDAGIVGKGGVQIELGVESSFKKDVKNDVRTRARGKEASGTITYGLTGTMDLVGGFPYIWGKVKEDGETVFDTNRLSDVSLEAKWRFLERNGFGLALKPGITLPTGNHKKGFGAGHVTYGFAFIVTKEIEPFAYHFNACYTRNENRVGERKDLWSASMAATYEAMKGLNVVGNIGFERNPDPTVRTAPAFALVGLSYAVNEYIMLDAGFKFGLNRTEVDHAVIAGITIAF